MKNQTQWRKSKWRWTKRSSRLRWTDSLGSGGRRGDNGHGRHIAGESNNRENESDAREASVGHVSRHVSLEGHYLVNWNVVFSCFFYLFIHSWRSC